ncbi:LacI family DNA-binding transcriptional regulator [Promicromonospora citrea]|uniref:LacI family DNA-binding transcriptional regulator n=1 Tax=Promicromonospora citrea TaxID=43677 RepID=UPI00148893A7|nr:LacI family DNA-binding transcriptional regulator [Promicromonospora citrea]NNH51561.1 LacI family DNA-binding transcriptional regulator [Promicromonospora citrea]
MTTPRTPQKPRGSGRPTISDVAALAGVSPGAVSKVFNGTGRISEATAERIRDAARKLSWRPNAAAIALRTARAQAIGLVLSSDSKVPGVGAGNMDFISGIESVLSPREYGLLLNVFISGQHDEHHFYRTLAERQRMDGIILTNSMVGDTRPELMTQLGLPAVLVGTPWKPGAIEYVDADPPGAGIAETVDHLVELGHERIAYVSGPKDFVLPVQRREAFVQRLAEHGRQPHAVVSVEYSPARAAEETTALLAAPVRPTAILYGTDTMAIAGMRTLQAAGLRVPDDISVVGFEGLTLGEWIDPPLTTVQRFAFQRGRAAAAKVLTLLGETVEEPVPLERPALVVRGSTGPAPR